MQPFDSTEIKLASTESSPTEINSAEKEESARENVSIAINVAFNQALPFGGPVFKSQNSPLPRDRDIIYHNDF